MVTGFHRDVDEIGVLLGCCTAYSGNSAPTFRDNLAIPSSRVKKSKKNDSSSTSSVLMMGPIGCPETSVRNYNSRLCSIPQRRRSQLWR